MKAGILACLAGVATVATAAPAVPQLNKWDSRRAEQIVRRQANPQAAAGLTDIDILNL